jgi:hypothetical protein
LISESFGKALANHAPPSKGATVAIMPHRPRSTKAGKTPPHQGKCMTVIKSGKQSRMRCMPVRTTCRCDNLKRTIRTSAQIRPQEIFPLHQ